MFLKTVLQIFNFNSIKVRLEPQPGVIDGVLTFEFQFHKGTIRTLTFPIVNCLLLKYFNSIKVRLEPINAFTSSVSNSFQFHKGTIRTEVFMSAKSTRVIFQFHKGTIRTPALDVVNYICCIISIP